MNMKVEYVLLTRVNMTSAHLSIVNDSPVDYRSFLPAMVSYYLNTLCRSYHAGYGYIKTQDMIDESSLLYVAGQVESWASVEDEEDGYHFVRIYPKRAEKLANQIRLCHLKVVIRTDWAGVTTWIEKPKDTRKTCFDFENVTDRPAPWYELPRRKPGETLMVGPISERTYITITDPYDEVQIEALKKTGKQKHITLDDIFFASRSLCRGPDRSVDKYHVLSDDGSTLTLMAVIDNFST